MYTTIKDRVSNIGRATRKFSLLSMATALVLGNVLFLAPNAFAAVTPTPASGGDSISADTTSDVGGSNTSTTLGQITITEGATTDFQFSADTAVTLILNAPSGFEFDTTSSPDVLFTSNRDIDSATTTTITALAITITVTPKSGNVTNNFDEIIIGSVTPIKVVPTSSVAGTTGNITNSGTINDNGGDTSLN